MERGSMSVNKEWGWTWAGSDAAGRGAGGRAVAEKTAALALEERKGEKWSLRVMK
jgi:hypothetical protein